MSSNQSNSAERSVGSIDWYRERWDQRWKALKLDIDETEKLVKATKKLMESVEHAQSTSVETLKHKEQPDV